MNDDQILSGIHVRHDSSHPDDRHTIQASVADLQWDDPDPAHAEPGDPGHWLLAYVDGLEVQINLPRHARQEAVEEARRNIARRLVTWSD